MKVKLPIVDLRSYQKPLWNYMLQSKPGLRAVVVWPRRNGKDLVAINILAAKALQRPGDYAYIAPFANQMRGIIWEGRDGTGTRFIDYVPRELVKRSLDQTMKLWLANGSTIQLFGSDNPDSLVGRNFVGMVFTEFSLHKDLIWGYMRPMLTENGGWALFNGTPRGINHFYAIAQVAKSSKKWFYEHLTAEDTGFPSKEDIEEERKAGMAESLIDQEFYTSWTASSEETLIPLESLKICLKTVVVPNSQTAYPRLLGVDPAYAEKGDNAAICERQGRIVRPVWAQRGVDPMDLASLVSARIIERKIDYVCIDAGRGEAVWSRLLQLGHGSKVIVVNFGGRAANPLKYTNRKTEMWDRARLYLCNKALPPQLPPDEKLIRDLSAPMVEKNEKEQLTLESKKSLLKRGFRSTDRADALVLTFAEDFDSMVDPRVEQLAKRTGLDRYAIGQMLERHDQASYNPLEFMEQIQRSSDSWR